MHRLFVWCDTRICPDSSQTIFARDDDVTFGVLHSRFHELWSLRLGTSLEDRPRYTPSTTFETFPFPAGLTPNVAAASYATDPRAIAVAEAARRLLELRPTETKAAPTWPTASTEYGPTSERRRCPFEPPGARQTPPAVDQTPDQAANRRKSPPLQAPGRTDAGQATQEQPDVAGGRLDQHALADILVTAHPHPTHTARLIQVRESTLHHLAPAALQATTPTPAHTPAVRIQRLLRRYLVTG